MMGSPASRAMALPSPTVDPDRQCAVRPQFNSKCASFARDPNRHVHNSFVEDHCNATGEPIRNGLSLFTLVRRAHYQCTLGAKPIELGRKLVDAVRSEDDTRCVRGIDEIFHHCVVAVSG